MKHLKVNHQISAPTVRLVDEEQEQLGIVGLSKALVMAQEKGMDLIEVSPKANPPVCKVMNYGKYLYQLKKNEQKQKKASKRTGVKGIRLSMRTDVGDMNIKIKKAREFLDSGNSIKVQLIFKGREIVHKELGFEKIKVFRNALSDIGKVDLEPKMQGYMITMMISPSR